MGGMCLQPGAQTTLSPRGLKGQMFGINRTSTEKEAALGHMLHHRSWPLTMQTAKDNE